MTASVAMILPEGVDDPRRPSGGNRYDRQTSVEDWLLGRSVGVSAVEDAPGFLELGDRSVNQGHLVDAATDTDFALARTQFVHENPDLPENSRWTRLPEPPKISGQLWVFRVEGMPASVASPVPPRLPYCRNRRPSTISRRPAGVVTDLGPALGGNSCVYACQSGRPEPP